MALLDRIYIRIGKQEKDVFQHVLKNKLQNQNVVVRALIRNYIKEYFIKEVKEVNILGEKIDSSLIGTVVITFTEKVECNHNNKVISSYKWDDIFEDHIDLLEYCLDI